jgi:hypothetical protein
MAKGTMKSKMMAGGGAKGYAVGGAVAPPNMGRGGRTMMPPPMMRDSVAMAKGGAVKSKMMAGGGAVKSKMMAGGGMMKPKATAKGK